MGHLLTDAYENPPLAPVLSAVQSISIGMALIENGAPLGADLSPLLGSVGSWGAAGPGPKHVFSDTA